MSSTIAIFLVLLIAFISNNITTVIGHIISDGGHQNHGHFDHKREQNGGQDDSYEQHTDEAHCDTSPDIDEVLFSIVKEEEFFSKPGSKLSKEERSEIIDYLSTTQDRGGQHNRRRRLQSLGIVEGPYNLRGIPIVFHVLPNLLEWFGESPNATEAQLRYITNLATTYFNIYDKETKTSVQWATFDYDQRILHDDFYTLHGCSNLTAAEYEEIVTKANGWEYKLHVLVCDPFESWGRGTFPWSFSDTSPMANIIWLNYRAIPCYDNDGNFLCDLTDGRQVSHAVFRVAEGKVFVHEIGHNMGLIHTFEDYGGYTGACDQEANDYVADTPVEDYETQICPGLLPYDRDRDMFDNRLKKADNLGGTAETCGGEHRVCTQFVPEGATCAACTCNDIYGCYDSWYDTEDVSDALCCDYLTPKDSCGAEVPGIDPKTNLMSYSYDWCRHEFTPGQLARMMAMIRPFNQYLYCNYADIYDKSCQGVPCGANATSPNCEDECPISAHLYNADIDFPVKVLDDKIDLCLYGGAALTIEGVAPCADSLEFRLYDNSTGKRIRRNVESNLPYTLGKDIDATGDILPVRRLQSPGNYTLELIPDRSSENMLTKSFEVDYFCGCDIKFVLWDADLQAPLGPLDDKIDRCLYENSTLSIEAVARCADSVNLTLSGLRDDDFIYEFRTEKEVPFMLGGNDGKHINPVSALVTGITHLSVKAESSDGSVATQSIRSRHWTCD